MPLLELKCGKCGEAFEYLTQGAGDEPACPACGAHDVRRLFSAFAVGSATGPRAQGEAACNGDPATCGRCSHSPASWN
ncbi:MAG: zinc ribbon domain-containing protein [bacterium]|mgnify:CR=1 FL=1